MANRLLTCALTHLWQIDYGQHSGVLQEASLELERSSVARTLSESAILDKHGICALCIHLRGVLFFGSAAQVDDAVRSHMRKLAARSPPLRLRFVILDCDRCEAMDASATAVLLLCQRQSGGASFLFAAASEEAILMQLRRRITLGGDFQSFETLDLALESVENAMLLIDGIPASTEGGRWSMV